MPINVKATSLIHKFEMKDLLNLSLFMLLLIKFNDINLHEGTYHVADIFRTGPRATHMVRAGNVVPAGTMLVAPDLQYNYGQTTQVQDISPLHFPHSVRINLSVVSIRVAMEIHTLFNILKQSFIINTTAKANDTTDILQTFR